MVVLIFNDQLFDGFITGPQTDGSPEKQWSRVSHDTHQNQTRKGFHEEIPCLQQDIGVPTVQTNQDTGAVDTSGVPPYLKRKLLMRYDATDRTSRTSCNCNCTASGGKKTVLGDTSTVSDDGDRIHSDYGDDDEDEAQWQQPGVGVGPSRNGEFPPRVRWLRRKQLHFLMTRRLAAMKCAHCRHDGHDAGKVSAAAVLARPKIQDSPLGSEKKRKSDEAETTGSESYNRNRNDDLEDESTGTIRKRQRVGSSGSVSSTPAIVQRIEGQGGLHRACEVAATPIAITSHLSAAGALSVGPRRSRRIWEKLGSACGTTPSGRS